MEGVGCKVKGVRYRVKQCSSNDNLLIGFAKAFRNTLKRITIGIELYIKKSSAPGLLYCTYPLYVEPRSHKAAKEH